MHKLIIIGMVIFFSWIASAELFSYTVSGSNSAKTLNIAKKEFIINNRIIALKGVLSKLILKEDVDKLDALISDEIINQADKQFKISNENLSENSYSATIEYFFNQKAIMEFLDSNKVNFTVEQNQNKIILIPVYNNLGKRSIWTLNPWFNLWQNIKNKDYLSTIIIPTQEQIKEQDIFSSNKEILNNLTEQLGANQIFIVILSNDGKGLFLEIINPLEVTRFTSTTLNTEEAFKTSMLEIENNYKQLSIERKLRQQFSNVLTFNLKGISEWVLVVNKLAEIKNIKDIQVLEMSMDYVKANVKYTGEIERLTKELRQQGLQFDEKTFNITLIN